MDQLLRDYEPKNPSYKIQNWSGSLASEFINTA